MEDTSLVIQHEHAHERGALLSHFWHGDRTGLVVREAHMLPSWLFFDQLLAYLGLRDDCRAQRVHLPMFPRAGSHIEIHTAEWAQIDEHQLLQHTSKPALSYGLDLEADAQQNALPSAHRP